MAAVVFEDFVLRLSNLNPKFFPLVVPVSGHSGDFFFGKRGGDKRPKWVKLYYIQVSWLLRC